MRWRLTWRSHGLFWALESRAQHTLISALRVHPVRIRDIIREIRVRMCVRANVEYSCRVVVSVTSVVRCSARGAARDNTRSRRSSSRGEQRGGEKRRDRCPRFRKTAAAAQLEVQYSVVYCTALHCTNRVASEQNKTNGAERKVKNGAVPSFIAPPIMHYT